MPVQRCPRLRGFAALSALLALFLPGAKAAENQLSIAAAGAVRDGVTLNTVVIQKAIDRLAAAGGGTLVVPPGVFLSGAIFLKPGVNLRLDKGAVLQGSTNILDYPEMQTRIEGHFQVWNAALVNGSNVDHLRISGDGMIQGGGPPFWAKFWKARASNTNVTNLAVKRPRNIFISDSKDVRISGISLRQSGFWNLHLFRCQDVVVENVDIRAPVRSPSTDGIDVDSCQNVAIHGCYISVDDDNICLKGNKGTSALEDKTIPPDQHIRVSDCSFGLGNSALTLGSEATLVRDVVIENCKLTGTNKNCVLKLKLRPDTEQHYEDITARNITVDNPASQLITVPRATKLLYWQGRPAPSQLVTNVTLENITGALRDFGKVDGPEKSTVANLTFKNINITLQNPAVVTKNVQNLQFIGVNINGAPYTGDPATPGN
ncbi:MAG: glycosyl hydrolase family 28 protein [Verrucomicrobiota bacterium]